MHKPEFRRKTCISTIDTNKFFFSFQKAISLYINERTLCFLTLKRIERFLRVKSRVKLNALTRFEVAGETTARSVSDFLPFAFSLHVRQTRRTATLCRFRKRKRRSEKWRRQTGHFLLRSVSSPFATPNTTINKRRYPISSTFPASTPLLHL